MVERSNDFQEILAKPPGFLIRRGLSLLGFFFLLFLVGSWIIKSPDIVTAHITITKEYTPVAVKARTTAKIYMIFVEEGQNVDMNDPIMLLENSTNYRQLFEMKELILKLDSSEFDLISFTEQFAQRNSILWDLQQEYSLLKKLCNEYYNNVKINSLESQKQLLNTQLAELERHISILKKAHIVAIEKKSIIQSQYKRDSILLEKELISKASFEETSKKLIVESSKVTQSELSLSKANIDYVFVNRSIEEIKHEILEFKQQYGNSIQTSIDRFFSAIQIWEKAFVISSTIKGKIEFTQSWAPNQDVKKGEIVVNILSDQEYSIIGKMQMPAERSSKLETGQIVNVSILEYPDKDYGMVSGTVSRISKISEDGFNDIGIEFPEGLTTSLDIELEFEEELEGLTRIIVGKRRIIEKFFSPIGGKKHK